MAWSVLVLMMVVATVSCLGSDLDDRWERFKRNNNRKYIQDVEPVRRGIWEAKVREIEQHNREADRGVHSYWMKETQWDDLTFEEFLSHGDDFDINNIHREKRASRNGTGDCFKEELWLDSSPYNYNSVSALPTSVDWTRKGYGRCGSCWAFSSVGAMEGQWYKKTKNLVSLSPQNLVDCSKRNSGCNGGLPARAFDYVRLNGIATDKSYPYTAKGGTCKRASATIYASVSGFKTINSERELLNAVARVGPISVGIKTGRAIQNYDKGVFTGCTGSINHAVLLVGYGVHNKKKVWKIKNSWGAQWGDKGYFYMTREVKDACGISKLASYPTVKGVFRSSINAGKVPSLGSTISGAVNDQLSFSAFLLSVCVILCMWN